MQKLLNKNYIFDITFILILWILAAIIINPIGNFPLNDDWAYSKNVFYLTEQGILKFSDWPAMSLIFHMLWGGIYCLIFDFSFTTLRFSTLILGLLGIITSYFFSLKISKNRFLSLFIAILIGFNPLYFSLSYTFMTDVPFIVWTIISIFFYINFLENKKIRNLLIAILFSLAAIFIRQTGILIPLVFFITFAYKNKNYKSILILLVTTAVVISSVFIYQYYLKSINLLPNSYSGVGKLFKSKTIFKLLSSFGFRSKTLLLYSGFFLFPLLIYIFPSVWSNLSKKQKIIRLLLSFLIFPFTLFNPFPTGNIFYNFGLGPKLLKDAYWELNISPQLPEYIFVILKIIGSIGAVLIIFYLIYIFSSKKNLFKIKYNIFFALTMLGFVAYLVLETYFFDRYYLFVIIMFVFLLAQISIKKNKIAKYISIFLLSFYIIFSVFATHDYLSWNRVRWEAIDSLTEQGISPSKIDGGFEFNGWHETNKRNSGSNINDKSWWFVKDDEYIISFGNIPGFEKIKTYKYNTFIPPRNNNIFILQRKK